LSNSKNLRLVRVKCDCGVVKDAPLNSLRLGAVNSCGCLQKIKASEYHAKHKKLLFTNDELKTVIEFVKKHPKGAKLPIEFINRFPEKTDQQLRYIVRSVRNNTLKRINNI
jgi:hypothetical protein